MRFHLSTIFRWIAALLAVSFFACSGGEADAAPAATAPSATEESAPTAGTTTDLGSLFFEVKSGPHAGSYGGTLSGDSSLSVRSMGEQQLVTFRIMHEREDGSTDVFNGTVMVDGPLAAGDVDLSGQLVTTGYLPDGMSREDRFFSYSSTVGSGTLTIETIDTDAGAMKGTYTVNQDGIETVGRFELTP